MSTWTRHSSDGSGMGVVPAPGAAFAARVKNNSMNNTGAGVPLPSAALVLEDNPQIAAALCEALLLAFPGVTPFLASTPEQARLLVLTERPQIAVIQLGLPGGGGLVFVAESCARTPSIHVIAAASHADSELIFPALRAGARGYLLVPERRENMMREMRAMLLGELPLTPPIARRFLERFDDETGPVPISGHERELLTQIAAGRSLRDLTWRIEGGHDSLHAHVRGLYEKLRLKPRSGPDEMNSAEPAGA